ncbi:DUF3889 domain-containing protein [Bacillus sp. B1-b2]|uniref:DUF3889 domain-containing protein n=1 Tax=Bacillus sp. B1-b2 TaxID=2653201 RepID=UPI0012622E25|nr:DUF3889 domain-containing protein [Bacillus sp. B1-b2]KAB7666883.1 DUF3889 domain-containing protein [Bacillus sp. B1-b2]
MKSRSLTILMGSVIVLMMAFMFPSHNIAVQKLDYEKYGSIAIAVVKADYPEEAVTDYEYVGRKKISSQEVQDSFRFQVKEDGKEKTVIVTINHKTTEDKFISLTVEEPK